MKKIQNNLSWIHISDIHFGHSKDERIRVDQQIVCDEILKDACKLVSKYGPPDYIFVTGDVAFRADSGSEYKQAGAWLKDLANHVGVNLDNLLIVPGNHDVDRAIASGTEVSALTHANFRSAPTKVDSFFSDTSVQDQLWPKFTAYSNFCTDLGVPTRIVRDNPFWVLKRETCLGKVNFLGLNTALLSYDDNDSPNNLMLGNKQLQAIQSMPEDELLIVLQHHPADWLHDGVDQDRFIVKRPHIQFCGHIHRQNAMLTLSMDGTNQSKLCFTSGAGHQDPNESAEHGYSWGVLSANGIEYMPRSWNDHHKSFIADKNKFTIESDVLSINLDALPENVQNWLPGKENVATSAYKSIVSTTLEPQSNSYEHPYKEFSKWMRKVMCYNQGKYFQFSFFASQLHKVLRYQYESEPYDFNTMQSTWNSLTGFLTRNITNYFAEHFEYIHSYFRGVADRNGSALPPRICVKSGLFDPSYGQEVVTIARDGGLALYESPLRISDNTGFHKVHYTGQPFACSDLPSEVIKGYRNPRINTEKALKFDHKTRINGIDQSWADCWLPNTIEGVDISPDPKSCYKSTLIIPITLINNRLETEFLELFKLSHSSESSVLKSGVDRSILGFLCFDHVDVGYFSDDLESPDVDMGYFLADIMSLYLLTMINYTHVSETFRVVTEQLKERDLLPDQTIFKT